MSSESEESNSNEIEYSEETNYFAELETEKRIPIASGVNLIQKTYKLRQGVDIEDNGSSNEVTENVIDSIQTIKKNLDSYLKKYRPEIDDNNLLALLDANAGKLDEVSKVIEHLQTNSRIKEIDPKIYVLQPEIKLVDANLAYRYGDLQTDVNRFQSLLTGFMGIGAASLISLVLFMLSPDPKDDVAIGVYLVAFGFSVFISIIFGLLLRAAQKKSTQARLLLEAEDRINEIGLKFD